MNKLIAKTKIKREKGWLYFTGTDEEGNISLWKAEMGKNKIKVKKNEI